MDSNKLDIYITTNQKYFPAEKIVDIREKLAALDDEKFNIVSTAELKDPTTILLLSIFLGELGIDRFFIGDIGMGVLKLLTGGLCGILWIIDMCTIQKKTRDLNYKNLIALL